MKKGQEKDLTNFTSQIGVVTFALFLAGGDQRAVDTEDVAIKANRLAPGRFSWRKYPEQINLELVRVYLSDAKKPEKGAWLVGSGISGWSLTPKGLSWAKRNSKRLLGKDLRRQRSQSKSGSLDENRWRRERARLLSTAGWKRWSSGDSAVTPREASEVFRIDSYAMGTMLAAKITRMKALFDDDPAIGPFLTRMAQLLSMEG